MRAFVCFWALLLIVISVVDAGGNVYNNGAQTKKRTVYWPGAPVTNIPGCASTDTFRVSLVIVDHIWLRFDPIAPANCSSYFFDSQVFYDTEANKTVSIGVLEDAASFFENVTEALDQLQGGLVVGDITTADLIDAIDTFDGEYGEDYDIITNSCASKIAQVGIYLDLPINQTILDWMAVQLNTSRVLELVRNSSNVGLMYPGVSTVDILAKPDAELIAHLVSWQAAREQAAYDGVLQYFQAQRAPRAAPATVTAPRVAPATVLAPQSSGSNAPSGTKAPVSSAPQANSKTSAASSFAVEKLLAIASVLLVSAML